MLAPAAPPAVNVITIAGPSINCSGFAISVVLGAVNKNEYSLAQVGKQRKETGGKKVAMGMSRTIQPNLWTRAGKRAFDVSFSIILLILLSPLLLLAAGLIKFTSRGPLLFTQDRAGKDGAVFRVAKFRTMRAGRTPDPKELVPLDHPDITPVGHWLRRLKIDELPQLGNVLRGEMSLVGPRPTLPDQAREYDAFRRQRLLVRPGVTGLAQVYSSAAESWDERILYDVAYVRACSLGLDLRILMRTLLVILFGEARTTKRFATTRFASFVSPAEAGFHSHRDHNL